MNNNINIDMVGTIMLHHPGMSHKEVYNMAKPYLCEFMEEDEVRAYVENKMVACCKICNMKEEE